MKYLLLLTTLLFSLNTYANSELEGVWCQKFDDFTKFLSIKANMDIELTAIGNTSGEALPPSKGYLSFGATSMTMVLDGHAEPIESSLKHGFFGKKFVISYDDGTKDTYTKNCR